MDLPTLDRYLGSVAVGTWDWDQQTDRVTTSPQAAEIFGLEGPEGPAADYLACVHPDDRPHLRDALERVAAGGDLECEIRLLRRDGQVRWASVSARLARDGSGRPTGATGAIADVTGHRASDERSLRLSSIIEATPDLIATSDAEGRIHYLNPAGRRLLGLEDGMDGVCALDVYPTWAVELMAREAVPAARREGIWRGESAVLGAGGKEIPVSQVLIAHDLPGGGHTFSIIVRDISEHTQREEQLRLLTEHDPLTGLRNRGALTDHLKVLVAHARRGAPGALVYVDIDQFKAVNETLGHSAGDRLLVMVAERLQSALRDEDVLARLGGDEFAVLLRDVEAEEALAVGEKLRRLIGELRFGRNPHVFALSASVGIALIDGRLGDGEVLAGADVACYTAKARGRNRALLYRPGQEEEAAVLSSDARWSALLKDALAKGRMRLLYQPVVDLTTGFIRRYEVLVRMVDENGALIAPGRFIPAAERFGLVADLDRWVLRRAVEAIESHARRGQRLPLAINLSGHSFGDDSTLESLRLEVAAADLEPDALSFEITETAAVINLPRARRFIQEMHELGCRFSLDDFGSGFSSFAYLRHLPVDSVKIDGSFVRDLVNDATSQALVRSMAEVAQATDKVTIAECVEDAHVMEVVRGVGIDWAQGWHLGMPSQTPEGLDRLAEGAAAG
jgi:diguanylate cyclase (GGDEF)-like protein/PAS domain S-box-containing protein